MDDEIVKVAFRDADYYYKKGVIAVLGGYIGQIKKHGSGCFLGKKPTDLKIFATYEKALEWLNKKCCPVCQSEVNIKDNKIEEHNHNEQICYGSYMPQKEIQ